MPAIQETTTRNSKLREMTKAPLDRITAVLHKALPDLTADHVTALGVVGTFIGAGLTLFRDGKNPSKDRALTAASLGTLLPAQAMDGIDGSLARLIAKENPEKINRNGPLFDAASDRIEEAALAMTRAMSANKRADKLGEWAALLSMITSPLPSLARAHAESKGKIVAEAGNGPLEFFGTRVGRALLSVIATEFPTVKDVPVQSVADILTITANILTTSKRLEALRKPSSAELPQQIVRDAEKRKNVLAAAAGLSALAAFGYIYIRNRDK